MLSLSDIIYDVTSIESNDTPTNRKLVLEQLKKKNVSRIFTVYCNKQKALEFRLYHGVVKSNACLRIWPNVTAEIKRAKNKPLYYVGVVVGDTGYGMDRSSVILSHALESIGVIPSECIGGRGINHDQLRRLASAFNYDFDECFTSEIEL